MNFRTTLLLLGLFTGTGLFAAEYFVAVDGDDAREGTTPRTAFATIQRGVDALAAGDTLTIAPGEYPGKVYREGLGAAHARTVIRAQLPGTVVLRGDVRLPAFRPAAGYRFVHVADVDLDGEVQTVNELDSLTVLDALPSVAALEFAPGAFHHDAAAGRLYLSTPDLAPPAGRPYSASIIGAQGFHLVGAQRVTIEGLAVTGFNRKQMAPRHERSQYATWGLLLVNSRDCILRECHAWLNGCGIMLNSSEQGSGHNVIARCRAWANATRYGSGDYGGLTIFAGRQDVIRDSLSFRNADYGANIRSEADGIPPRDDEGNYIFNVENQSRIVRTLAWGNGPADLKIKTGYPNIHRIEHSVGDRPGSRHNLFASLFRTANFDAEPDSVIIDREPDLDPDRAFADPTHHDYRPQAGAPLRGTGPHGADRGPFPYEANIFYVHPAGHDAADGLSIATAWKTPAHAARNLPPGATLYIEGGVYDGELELTSGGDATAPVVLRGRGRHPVILRGAVRVTGGGHVEFTRLNFSGDVTCHTPAGAARPARLVFDNCTFSGAGLSARRLAALRVTHCLFANATLELRDSAGVHLAGNLFAIPNAPAVILDAATQVRYADYNLYTHGAAAWSVAGATRSLAELSGRYSRQADVSIQTVESGLTTVVDPRPLAAAGPFGTRIGRHSFYDEPDNAVRLAGPWVRSVSDTTANIEWGTSGPTHDPESGSSSPASVRIDWGPTPRMEHHTTRQAHRFGDFSLTGLEPDTEYDLRLTFFRPLHALASTAGAPVVAVDDDSVTLRFRTAATAHEPRRYHVAPDGDDTRGGLTRDTAWRTLNHAARRVAPGDTVFVGGGTYHEAVRLRATGERGRPITFQAAPGEKVVIDGLGRSLEYAFFGADKSHLRFDGFYLVGLRGRCETAPWGDTAANGGAFVLYESHDVRITRCFMDGRGNGSSPGLAHARHCKDFVVENNVMLNCMGRLQIYWNSPRARIRHNVFLRNFITHVGAHIRGARIQEEEDWCRFEYNIVTDNLLKKLHVGLGINARNRHNGFYLRVPPAERTWNRREETTFADMLAARDEGDRTLVADPIFAGTREMDRHDADGRPLFLADRLVGQRDLDFPDLFALNPDVVDAGIGLQPEAFSDFHFQTNSRPREEAP